MTKKQFLEIFNDIDDDLIKPLIDEPERPQKIFFSENITPSLKRAFLSAAAVLCVFTVGFLTIVKLHTPTTENPPDSILDNPATLPNIPDSNISEILSSIVPTTEEKLKRAELEGEDFEIKFSEREDYFIQTVSIEKTDGTDYAAVHLVCRNVSEENPIFVSVHKSPQWERTSENNLISSYILIDINGKISLTIKYTEQATVGEKYYLEISRKKTSEPCVITGRWLP